MKTVGIVAACLAFVALNYLGVGVYSSALGLGFGDVGGQTASLIALCIAMCAGIVVSSLVVALRSLPSDKIVSIRALGNYLGRPNTFIALLVSPVVFYSILAGLGNGELGWLHYLAAFQNGFFWETALVGSGAGITTGGSQSRAKQV
ncbi:MAG TPA: hypothetical protein VGO04_23260 [Ensifer sp.]|jgi:hypothetical protein|uniref:hypothetical protein n=1 Tax=Ensifer sp. TaxID=1872086 RepID=UPI002E10DBF1|nr:hypothetical protein [Ensifer sp.]